MFVIMELQSRNISEARSVYFGRLRVQDLRLIANSDAEAPGKGVGVRLFT